MPTRDSKRTLLVLAHNCFFRTLLFLLILGVVFFCAIVPALQAAPQAPDSALVIIHLPANGAKVTSPVEVSATAMSTPTATLMQIYLDGKKVFEVKASSLDTSLKMSNGSHRLTVQAFNGTWFKTTENITVSSTSPGVSISISPTSATVATGATQQFTDTVTGSNDTSVTFSVDGVTGGNATVGTISSTGLYTAPGSAGKHTVTVTSNADPTKRASAQVTVTSATGCKPTGGQRTVTICAPGKGAMLPSPVEVSAAANSSPTATLMQIYLDRKKVFETHASSLDTVLDMSNGTHRLTVQAFNGTTFKTTEFITVSGGGAVVYVSETSDTLGGLIEGFALDSTSGVLTPLAGSPFATSSSNTNDMALARNSGNLYVLGQQFPSGASSLLVFALDPNTGVPSFKQSLATNASETSKLAVAPSGKFVYVAPYSGGDINGIGIFAVQSDGTLVASGSLASTQSTGDVVISPNGAFLYTSSDGGPVGNLGNNNCGPFYSFVWGFSVDAATGALAPLPGSPFTFQRQLCIVGHAPNYVTKQIDPRGQRLFVIDSFNADITSFAINPSTGALTLLPGTTTEGAIGSFTSSAVDPLSGFLYVGSTVDFFTGFSLTGNAASGVLPLLAGMPAQVAPLPNFDEGSRALAVDSSGNFLFSNENEFTSDFSCCGPDDFVEFRIDSATGALTQLRSAPAKLAGTASRIVPAPPR